MSVLNKFFTTPIKQRLSTILVSQNQVRKWSSDWNFFFILGFGRSGTNFMANLLNQAEGAYVYHEPVLEDFYAHLRAHYNPNAAQRYMTGFRRKEIYSRMQNLPVAVYGEVNGLLRCHVEAIKLAFPRATLLHLVRDGREVVRSTVSRKHMTYKHPLSQMIRPTKEDPMASYWSGMDRFSRICWYWQEENKRLRERVGRTVQLERILSSYEYFSTQILEPCHINIDEKDWEIAGSSPKNTTSKFSMPKWDTWTPEQQRTFREICGEEMEKCGYEF